jgi:hypothetical protein
MTLGIFGLPLGFEVTVSDGFTGLLFDIAGSFLKSAFDFAGPSSSSKFKLNLTNGCGMSGFQHKWH